MQTEIAKQLGIEFPIFAFTHCRDVVVAVEQGRRASACSARSGFTPEQLEIELDWIDEHIGDKPYGVDIVIPGKYEGMGELDPDKLEDDAARRCPRRPPRVRVQAPEPTTACPSCPTTSRPESCSAGPRPPPPRRSRWRSSTRR